MCGIVGFAGRERAVPYLISCLERLEYRGYDSAGIALSSENAIEVTRRKGRISELTSAICAQKRSDAHCGIGHTRWATHGIPDEKNAHPHLSANGYFAVVHNGIIENYEKLKNDLIGRGCVFSSDTDTEVIAQLLEKNYSGDFISAVKTTLSLLEGSYAVAILCKDYPGKIFCSRWGSPIVIAKTERGNFISSDINSLLEYTDEIYKLDGGESALIDSDSIEFFDRDMKKISKSPKRLKLSTDDTDKQGYEHFMLKEIYEQAGTVKKCISRYVNTEKIVFPDFCLSDSESLSLKRILFIGCGSAYHAGMSAKYVTERLTGIYCSAEVASEWRYGSSPVDESCLCVFISQSGETADTLAALRKARASGAKILSVVNVNSSSVASESDSVIYTKAGPEIAVATTKAYTAQLVCLYLLAIKIARLRGKISIHEQRRLCKELEGLERGVEEILGSLPEQIKAFSGEYAMSMYMYFIGRGTDYAAAMEGALKLKEISYIPCEAYAAGELKHGTISLVEKGTPVIALAGNPDAFSKTVSNIKEVKSRGARVIALCRENDAARLGAFCDRIIALPCCEGIFSAVYEGVALQLFAYHIAQKRGCDIDRPRNLAKSVTVE